MHMLGEMEELGYGFSDLLFYKNGEISPEVYDVVLYHVLKKSDDPGGLAGGLGGHDRGRNDEGAVP